MDAETIKKLRELAEKATPGSWETRSISPRTTRPDIEILGVFGPSEIVANLDGIAVPDRMNDRLFAEDAENMRFIAAANPAVILSLIDALDTQSSRTEAVTDEHYARGYGLRCMIVDHLNGAIDRDELRRRFTDWEYRCSGTRFSVSPAQIAEWSGNRGSTVSRTEAMRKALERIDAFWTADFPEGPEGDRNWAGGLGKLSDDTIEVWREIRAALLSTPNPGDADGTVAVPKAALDWLFGEGPDPSGHWFGDVPDEHRPKGSFWWRDVFKAMLTSPPPSSLREGSQS